MMSLPEFVIIAMILTLIALSIYMVANMKSVCNDCDCPTIPDMPLESAYEKLIEWIQHHYPPWMPGPFIPPGPPSPEPPPGPPSPPPSSPPPNAFTFAPYDDDEDEIF